jgi:hypothetical protein
MSTTPPTRRPWFQFSLATMLVIVTLLGGFLAYHVNWIRQRQGFRTVEHPRRSPIGGNPFPDVFVPAPGLLWLFGEKGHYSVELEFTSEDGHLQSGLTAEEEKEKARVQRLFPEAHINWMNYKKAAARLRRAREQEGQEYFIPRKRGDEQSNREMREGRDFDSFNPE